MKRTLGVAGFLVLCLAAHAVAQPAPYPKSTPPLAVETVAYDWTDAARQRQVPVKIYFPKPGDGPFPVIIFSHGLGGTREGYEYLGRHWAECGYVSVHVQHVGSDDSAWKGQDNPMESMRRAAANPANAINRPLDIRFVLDRLALLNREDSPLKGRLDLGRIGMAGHSFGAYTTQAVIGEVFTTPRGREISLPDPRVKAAIVMSPTVPARLADPDKAFGSIKVPCFWMTGTADDSPIGDGKAADRRVPFDHMAGSDRYLLTFTGGDHMVFSGRPRPGAGGDFEQLPGVHGSPDKDAHFHELILASTTAFWDAYLKGDAAAKSWLAAGGFTAALGADGTFEIRPSAGAKAGGTSETGPGRP